MGVRTRSRELALQALFYMDMHKNIAPEMLERYCRNFKPDDNVMDFFLTLVNGVIERRPRIDEVIDRHSANWKIGRMSCVDRNVLRLGVFELTHLPDTPAKVAINEAINSAKKFGTEESGAFINGILDSVRIELEQGRLDDVENFPGASQTIEPDA